MKAYKYKRTITTDLIHGWSKQITEIFFKIGEGRGICFNDADGIFYCDGEPFSPESELEEIEINSSYVDLIDLLDELIERELEVNTLKDNIKNITKSFLA